MPPPPAPEGTRPRQAAEALKVRVNDPARPTLDLARDLQSHLDAYPQSQKELSESWVFPRSVLI